MWAARGLRTSVLDDATLLQNPKLLQGCEAYRPLEVHVLCRFGRWDDVLRIERASGRGKEEEEETFCVSEATRRWGRALALAVTGRCGEARAEMEEMSRVMEKVKEQARYLHNNQAYDMLIVEREKLLGEILWGEGRREKAFEVLREAVVMDDGLNYDEPWGVMAPVRHALGGLLLKAASLCCGGGEGKSRERLEEASSVFRRDLELHPKNPWALRGLCDSLRARRLLGGEGAGGGRRGRRRKR